MVVVLRTGSQPANPLTEHRRQGGEPSAPAKSGMINACNTTCWDATLQKMVERKDRGLIRDAVGEKMLPAKRPTVVTWMSD